ncbi:hypothetical protein J2736_000982 [Paenibacillus qinlingensis]|uniref:Uncharacterized protein n=1 Tax=Paenibacillus qinlingensis TaxID=1837343 RepID=A0ABU1NR07_9BACL|nr:hypothetical protein [Paenibacillus qinlingensis]
MFIKVSYVLIGEWIVSAGSSFDGGKDAKIHLFSANRSYYFEFLRLYRYFHHPHLKWANSRQIPALLHQFLSGGLERAQKDVLLQVFQN